MKSRKSCKRKCIRYVSIQDAQTERNVTNLEPWTDWMSERGMKTEGQGRLEERVDVNRFRSLFTDGRGTESEERC